jgi:two-component system, OmpR family, alkaline phosphatase synthesis response regulator PhoP
MAKPILIVDDDPNIVIAVEFLMRQAGYEVAIAHDGQQALDYLVNHDPALMILDVMMPNKNGFEVCEEVRADSRLADMPILMLTAKGREAEKNKGLALGANAYMSKPFSTHDLVDLVKSLLRTVGRK